MSSSLDQIVKGAPPPNLSLPAIANSASPSGTPSESRTPTPTPSPDPASLLPSSPPQIYLNLLILEASLRTQYLTLLSRRRTNSQVLLALCLWLLYFSYCVFLSPRPDGLVGGSVYWAVDVSQKIALLGGAVMGFLFWGTGQWERGIRWPRRWVGTTNRGLRGWNCKVVIIKGGFWEQIGSLFGWLMPAWLLFPTPGQEFAVVEYTAVERKSLGSASRANLGQGRGGVEFAEEDIAPGGDCLKLLLLPKPFTPDFRENWETYRTEYWERENERRAELRKRVSARRRKIAKQEGGWLWW
ncbi:hypothetical protein K402DRAFT_300582, partial [Aulographum hederae CBS 113979]